MKAWKMHENCAEKILFHRLESQFAIIQDICRLDKLLH